MNTEFFCERHPRESDVCPCEEQCSMCARSVATANTSNEPWWFLEELDFLIP